ncbi:flavodoxin family protein [Clostridium polynesiense]|uniref:flavodoxin family protein n=1 Tax=Clostridium polynesiense TaxID=1325933 RepID=UPI0006947B57|nr:hypothetical protein [Clostridium polynesiense]
MKDKILVVYFTRSGTSEKIALELNKHYKCIIDKIEVNDKLGGVYGYLRAAYQGKNRIQSSSIDVKNNPGEYYLTIIVTPLWAGNMSSPVRAYINKYKNDINSYGLIITHKGGSYEKAVKDTEEILQKKALFTKAFKEKHIDAGKIDIMDLLKFSH